MFYIEKACSEVGEAESMVLLQARNQNLSMNIWNEALDHID